ncbi:hypothetical protein FOL75_12210 [Bacillus thuringiensis]|uniref:hypothetical protein n=1 Tax=Bacillus thuringiensis TaxID=1428 RepID=UPI002853C9C3|nr:hypothetical protein [Bacillus thuringiensis]MDR5022708.1 hypothetical protein [Bacillus thuringiensis]
MSETVKYQQMSIYDFIETCEDMDDLEHVKSQEVQPSETVPQVDEAQEEKRIPVMFRHEWKTESPSSALDTEESTEDTDKTLFSVGDVLTVRVPDFEDSEPENYYFIKALEGKHFKVLDIDSLHITCEAVSVYDDKIYKFYHYEVRRVK